MDNIDFPGGFLRAAAPLFVPGGERPPTTVALRATIERIASRGLELARVVAPMPPAAPGDQYAAEVHETALTRGLDTVTHDERGDGGLRLWATDRSGLGDSRRYVSIELAPPVRGRWRVGTVAVRDRPDGDDHYDPIVWIYMQSGRERRYQWTFLRQGVLTDLTVSRTGEGRWRGQLTLFIGEGQAVPREALGEGAPSVHWEELAGAEGVEYYALRDPDVVEPTAYRRYVPVRWTDPIYSTAQEAFDKVGRRMLRSARRRDDPPDSRLRRG
jgi:hypothetical protein